MQSFKRIAGSILTLAVLLALAWISTQAEDSGRRPGDSPAPSASVPATLTSRARPTARPLLRTPTPTPRPARATATPPASEDGLATVSIERLPDEARVTIGLIDRGGPFPYEKDGATFGNRERLLPRQPSGYYREYTVITPGSDDRGARRIVAGDNGELYYTDDHYASFRRVVR
ncbi:MAG TPA: ribonuclease domain-containing protein [Herpetosiphonaceae bacterium]|nr:ribonuclease domain-containing protein [Herpetosiphonaceae bacterium]